MLYKLLIGFEGLSHPDFFDKVVGTDTALNAEPALSLIADPWPGIYPSRVQLTAASTSFRAKYEAARNGGKAERDARDLTREILTGLLKQAAPYFESVARAANDVTILDATGYDRAHDKEPIPQPPEAPTLKLQRGPVSGKLIARTNRPKGTVMMETQRCTGDPGVEGNWNGTIQTTGCKHIELTACTPGVVHFVRSRAIGHGGPGRAKLSRRSMTAVGFNQ